MVVRYNGRKYQVNYEIESVPNKEATKWLEDTEDMNIIEVSDLPDHLQDVVNDFVNARLDEAAEEYEAQLRADNERENGIDNEE